MLNNLFIMDIYNGTNLIFDLWRSDTPYPEMVYVTAASSEEKCPF